MIRFEHPRFRASTAIAGIVTLLATALPSIANSHSASDAYLTLTVAPPPTTRQYIIHGQWDIAIRDLDFVLKLDDDGDGRVTWGELRKHRAAIADYAYRYIQASGGERNRCSIKPQSQMVDDHADGAYASLFFDIVCNQAPRTISLEYTLFFGIDPSHRGIFIMNSGTDIATALLSPDNSKIDLALARTAGRQPTGRGLEPPGARRDVGYSLVNLPPPSMQEKTP